MNKRFDWFLVALVSFAVSVVVLVWFGLWHIIFMARIGSPTPLPTPAEAQRMQIIRTLREIQAAQAEAPQCYYIEVE